MIATWPFIKITLGECQEKTLERPRGKQYQKGRVSGSPFPLNSVQYMEFVFLICSSTSACQIHVQDLKFAIRSPIIFNFFKQ